MAATLPSFAEAALIVDDFASSLLLRAPRAERVPLESAHGRVLAAPVLADADIPAFPRSTRDGFACRAAEASAHAWLKVAGSIRAGDPPAGPLPRNAAWEIMTGAPVPPGADAVAMLEHVEHDSPRIRLAHGRALEAGENLVPAAAEARAGDEIVPAGTSLGPAQIAAAAACGYAALDVHVLPRVAILTTGDELVPVDTTPGPGRIRNSNAPMLAALVARAGGKPRILPAAADNAEAIRSALQAAHGADLLLISGGVSAGKFDLVEPALAALGATFHFTGVRIQPGKPLVFGEIPRRSRSLPIFGLPGNPISSAATFLLFASAILRGLAGHRQVQRQFSAAVVSRAVKGKPGLTRFVPSSTTSEPLAAGLPEVAPVPWHGSGDLPAFARANCFLVVPEGVDRLPPGALACILPI